MGFLSEPAGAPAAVPPPGAGGAGAGGATSLNSAEWSAALQHALQALRVELGNSTNKLPGVPARNISGVLLPPIPAGVPTTIIPVVFPVLPGSSANRDIAIEDAHISAVFMLAALIWLLPWLCANNSKLCCRCFRRFMSRRLHAYCWIGFLANLVIISCVIANEPDVSANDIFFGVVRIIEKFTDQLQEVLTQAGLVFGIALAYSFRQKVVTLLGFDSSLVRADLRDILTCFSMRRFSTIEIAILKASGLPAGFGSRSLFLRVVSGMNEPMHSRPRDGCVDSMVVKERMQLNYDPSDSSQTLALYIKQQEIVGQAVKQLAPAVGMVAGGAAGMMTPLGPQGGAAIGAVAGIGTANSLGPEVARLEMSSAMINRLLDEATRSGAAAPSAMRSTAPLVPWAEEYFTKVDLVPQGAIWLRIMDREKT
mmetsp:Transcript_67155/g.187959  ORF Transcript_67155/g.187959 Transcript_67155/m.187959 type:complete len:424 (+) Transcript_67155:48-1319(+)